MHWEGALDTNLERNLANGESLANAFSRAADNDALEDLNTRAVTFDDVYVNLDGVTSAKVRNVGTKARCIYCVENVHFVIHNLYPLQVEHVFSLSQRRLR